MADIVLAGVAEAPLHDVLLAQLASAGVLGTNPDPARACLPFDANRNGTVVGEGAAFLVLESLGSARRRGARVYARFAGWSMNSEPAQRTGISERSEGLQRAMRRAVSMAGLTFADLDYINAHGTGTAMNDRAESLAIAQCNTGQKKVRTSSTKAVTGHCMGAGSAIEAVISILALERQILPPSANCFTQADDCPVELVRDSSRPAEVRAVLTNSLGFWGNHASLVFTEPPEA
jgi:3-oxoacyl-(acyl-carrier-protein) synthase